MIRTQKLTKSDEEAGRNSDDILMVITRDPLIPDGNTDEESDATGNDWIIIMPICSSIQHISSSSTLMSMYECSGGIMQMAN